MTTVCFSEQDKEYMSRALELAKKGRFTSAPNPNVGCVIVLDDIVVGTGFHFKAGQGHAEVYALAMAGSKAQSSTCYVTLEPCSHFGRTPPCALALIKAGVKRVCVAMRDPNPQVAGQGIKLLQDAGIEVSVGLLEPQAKQLNLGFINRMLHKRARVTLKLGASLDGKTALKNGKSQWITGSQSRCDVQHFRAQQSAILSSASTVLADDPSLNVRFEELQQSMYFKGEISAEQLRQPLRIILDSRNKLTGQEKIFSLPGDIILVALQLRHDLSDFKGVAQVQSVVCPADEAGNIDLRSLLKLLNRYELNDIWLEVGATLAGAFFKAQLVDQFILYQAPKLMGAQARSLVNLDDFSTMDDVLQLTLQEVTVIGNDIRIISNRD
ncbi:bifunctional diaminohydroxyphosphoribosylaminopyrimidine deaminase and 5-amino-6-(5-phosphoribosylamino) uracil reductase [Psychromonas sp. CNPT3]|uniref:bifunctional diaminohydroxyphosphoribosylaminopyrimidine deaminase/5-amino-6-(5-phosphoribosylamino)uracil reductase RibD n=1 Tax=Psychromonas sp. CNPT3 TaxID=314282 RepID=UPI00006E8088|nr:bifunctional diaminohydroxyphosphoribosylaminopyrimidine deaminase/5-amino-6-(5-phosphoribosylamino)uracil reductase RibD [Psychromonas sp. CNPT3]AGH80827.1 bifunctional diaminohydroxyphosphoribosylaminopyrimidine deaminase and 5-amino-6-(5-phosphoribosylamino) uracil reductase [Psychromonas sp. CNPT3]